MGHRHMSESIHRGVIVKLSGETLTGGESFGVSDGRHNLRACPKKPYAYHFIFDRRTRGRSKPCCAKKLRNHRPDVTQPVFALDLKCPEFVQGP
jgi:hypothetical protein